MDPILTKGIERDAIALCQQGDREAFRRVLDFHGDHLYRVALLITRDASLAEEAVQESLLAAWKKIHSFDLNREFRPWINRILINCIGMMQRRKRLPTSVVEDAFPLAVCRWKRRTAASSPAERPPTGYRNHGKTYREYGEPASQSGGTAEDASRSRYARADLDRGRP